MVPIEAVIVKDDGKFVKVLDKKTKQIKEVKVKTGITTLDSVEIIKGLKAGDCVIVSNV
jgi:multidrug efflux pump subunit AcrA (membrane-fusion protein)